MAKGSKIHTQKRETLAVLSKIGTQKRETLVVLIIVLVCCYFQTNINLRIPAAGSAVDPPAGGRPERPPTLDGDFSKVLEPPPVEHAAVEEQQLLPYGDTTIVITTSLIPAHPSIQMINDTIQSLYHLVGLHPEAPIIVTADFVRNGTSPEHTARFDAFLRNLLQEYGPRISILVASEYRGQSWSMYNAIQFVKTEFMYVLQHDMPFCRDIDHTNSIKSMKEYPNNLRMIRFPLHIVEEITGLWDRRPCFAKPTPVDYVNGLNFTKTPGWSDK